MSADLRVRLNLVASGFQAGLQRAQASASGFARNVGGAVSGAASRFASLTAGIGSLVGAASGAAAALKSISAAADMEQMRVGFQVMLGSVGAAKKRMEELAAFAAATPFELPEIAQASRVLQVLTGGALATGKGLTLVGDIAAGTGKEFSEIAMWVGRLYDALQSGRPAGEAMSRLSEMGVVSGKTRAALEALADAGVEGNKVWEAFAGSADVTRYAGMMELQARTFKGMMSTFGDETGAVFRNFGEPLNEALKPIIDKITGFATALQPAAARMGAMAADVVRIGAGFGKAGGLTDALSTALQILWARLKTLMRGLVGGLLEALRQGFKALGKGEFWAGMLMSFRAAVLEMAATLVEVMGPALKGIDAAFTALAERVMAGPGGGKKRERAAELKSEIERLTAIRDEYAARAQRDNDPNARHNALGAGRSIMALQEDLGKLGFIPRTMKEIMAGAKEVAFGFSAEDLHAKAAEAQAQAGEAWGLFAETGAVSGAALEKAFGDAMAKGADTAELEKTLARQLRAAWDAGLEKPAQAAAAAAKPAPAAVQVAAVAAAAAPAKGKEKAKPSIAGAVGSAVEEAGGEGPFRSISGKPIPRKRLDARSRRHRDLWGRVIRGSELSPATTSDAAVAESKRGAGAGASGGELGAIAKKVEGIGATLEKILTQMPKTAVG